MSLCIFQQAIFMKQQVLSCSLYFSIQQWFLLETAAALLDSPSNSRLSTSFFPYQSQQKQKKKKASSFSLSLSSVSYSPMKKKHSLLSSVCVRSIQKKKEKDPLHLVYIYRLAAKEEEERILFLLTLTQPISTLSLGVLLIIS